jgi:predicted site-specific integrase-resolvase
MEMQGLEIERPKVQMYPDGRMDPENAARYLGVSPKTLTMWRCAGTGPPFVYVGGKVFYFQRDLDEHIQKTRVTSTAQARVRDREAD